jgi:hypothetical protein
MLMNDYLFVPGGVAFPAGGVDGMVDWAGGRLENNGVCRNPLLPAGAAKGDEAGALIGAGDCFNNASLSASALDFWCCLEATTAMRMARPKNMPAAYLVILVRTLPEPAPNRASVAPLPKASPAPASFFGSCSSTSRTRMTQSINIRKVRKI